MRWVALLRVQRYTWEQYDVATANDKGALGSSIVGTGGYYAVNSTTAPLFRSQMSSTVLDRNFPKLTHILNSANDPAVGEGENLPQVARNMKFRFTVRDNRAGGGGVDSDETIVTVDKTQDLFCLPRKIRQLFGFTMEIIPLDLLGV